MTDQKGNLCGDKGDVGADSQAPPAHSYFSFPWDGCDLPLEPLAHAQQEVRPGEGRGHTSAFLGTLDACGLRVQLVSDLTFEVFPNQLGLWD